MIAYKLDILVFLIEQNPKFVKNKIYEKYKSKIITKCSYKIYYKWK